MNAHKEFVIIMRDNLAIDSVHTDDSGINVLAWFHKNTNQSMDWELANNGYAIVTLDNQVNGWLSYLTMSTRRGYGVDGSIARMAVEIDRLVSSFEKDNDKAYGQWRDYVAEPAIVSMLSGFVALLQHTGPGAFRNVRGALSGWAIATAARIGYAGEL